MLHDVHSTLEKIYSAARVKTAPATATEDMMTTLRLIFEWKLRVAARPAFERCRRVRGERRLITNNPGAWDLELSVAITVFFTFNPLLAGWSRLSHPKAPRYKG
jgi:hypothetical protein